MMLWVGLLSVIAGLGALLFALMVAAPTKPDEAVIVGDGSLLGRTDIA